MRQIRLKKRLRAALSGALCVLMAGLCACSTGSGNSSHLESTNPPSSQEGSSNTSVASSGSNKNEWILPEGYDMKKLAEKPEADSGKNGQLYYVDLNALLNELGGTPNLKADFMRFASCMQGILNREKPVMFVEYVLESDVFWYNYLRQEGKTLYGYKRVNISTLDDFFSAFGEEIQRMGLILWDVKVPSTANVSVTVSGIEEWLPVRGDEEAGSLLNLIQTKVSGVEVKYDLRGKFTGKGTIPDVDRESSGSTKCDAYIWAMEKYLDKTSDSLLANIVDGVDFTGFDVSFTGLVNMDYYTANKVFLFDLSPWGDETPNDDPNQPLGTDFATFKELLQRMYDRTLGQKMISVSGFVPWHLKYTVYGNNGKHGEVESEWHYAQILTAYNCFLDADGIAYNSLANASIYQQYKIQNTLTNNRPDEIPAYDPTKKYVLFYMGDYDAAAWTTRFVARYWCDQKRGKNPLAWPYNPNLSERVPMVFEYIYEYKSPNDYFVAGDSGAGYVNPNFLVDRVHSSNPPALDVWSAHCEKYYDMMDLDITGFLLNSAAAPTNDVLDAYAKFSPGGIITHNFALQGQMHGEVPLFGMTSDAGHENGDVNGVADTIYGFTQSRRAGPKFYIFRSVLCSPSYIDRIVTIIQDKDPNIEIVDPYTFMALVKEAVK